MSSGAATLLSRKLPAAHRWIAPMQRIREFRNRPEPILERPLEPVLGFPEIDDQIQRIPA